MIEPERYENLVKELLTKAIASEFLAGKVLHGRKIRGRRSGYDHQVDLSLEVDLAGTRLLVIVECKALTRPVSVDDALEFASRIDDIGAHKGIMVSSSGFTAGAVTLAESRGIALIQAYVGGWWVMARSEGQFLTRRSERYFSFAGCRLVARADHWGLELDPVNESGIAAVCPFDEASLGVLMNDTRQGWIGGHWVRGAVCFELKSHEAHSTDSRWPGRILLL
jgi:hypothetical protein